MSKWTEPPEVAEAKAAFASLMRFLAEARKYFEDKDHG